VISVVSRKFSRGALNEAAKWWTEPPLISIHNSWINSKPLACATAYK